MKNIIFVTLLVTTNAFAMVGKVPTSWMNGDVEKSFVSPENTNLDEAYQQILDANASLFETIPQNNSSKWYLQSIQTELAIESEGTLGVMGAGGEAALELVWIKKENEQKLMRPKLSEEISPEAEEIVITSEMNEETLKKEISPVVDLALASGHIKKRHRLFKNLLAEALKFQKTASELENSPAMGPWYAYKYQLELYVSAEGDIGFAEVGNAIRLRLEWWRLQKNTKAFETPYVAEELSPNAKFVAAIASDVAAADRLPFENGFRFNCMKVGVGTTVEGNLFLVKGKASAVGSLFFKRDEVATFGPEALMTTAESYQLSEKGNLQTVPRYSFRKGIEKAAAITHFFAKHAKTKNPGQFELNVIEAEFELYGNGGIGVVTVEGAAVLTLFVTRNVTI
ncbi:MAG: hypothetical protein ACJ76H_06405 [Bacteriovoracaceae bacterium]